MITRLKLSTIEQGLPKYRSMLAGNDAYVPSSFESIASATGTGSSGTITFSSISGTYQHLQLRMIVRSDAGGTSPQGVYINFNSDAGNNYAWHDLYGDGSATAASGSSSVEGFIDGFVARAGTTANIVGAAIMDIHDYASTTKNKTLRFFGGLDLNGSGQVRLASVLRNNTAAITSISIKTTAGNFTTSTQFALYGIKGA